MLKEIADNANPLSVANKLRQRRFAFFHLLLEQLEKPITVLDVGGTVEYWQLRNSTLLTDLRITVLNLHQQQSSHPNISTTAGDALKLAYPDEHFDVVFSNSVIEHVGDYSAQRQMANEIRRVGKRYFIQTPNKYFPIEPHFLFPYFQLLPISLQTRLLMNFNLGWYKKNPDYQSAKETAQSVKLLSEKELLKLFPGATIYKERIFGLVKSYTALSGWNSHSG